MKRLGREVPAQHQTISGDWLLFHFTASDRTRAASVGDVRSALI